MIRRLPVAVLLAMLLAATADAGWRSAHGPRGDPAGRIAAQLRCPACDGESVAESRSPVAAAMRATIAEQLAAGRSPGQIRAWFVDRCGPGVLTEPPADGVGVLLWLVPAGVLAAMGALALRAVRRREPPVTARTDASRSRLR